MSPLARAGGKYHRIAYHGGGIYVLSWAYEVKHGRTLAHRTISRDTDRKGAERFAKKWGCDMPRTPGDDLLADGTRGKERQGATYAKESQT